MQHDFPRSWQSLMGMACARRRCNVKHTVKVWDKLRIPIEAGHLFRDHSGHHSDLKPATVPR